MFMQIDCMFFKTVKKNNTNNTTYKKNKTDLDSILCSAIKSQSTSVSSAKLTNKYFKYLKQ